VQVELLFAAAVLEIGAAEEEPGVLAHQERQVRLLDDEVLVDQPLLHQHVGHAETQRRVAAGLDRNEEVRVHARSAVVGGDAHDLRPLVARLRQEVGVGDLGVDRITAPDQDQVRVEVVVGGALEGDLPEGLAHAAVAVSDLGVHVEIGGVQQNREALVARGHGALGVERAEVPDDAIGAVSRQGVEDRISRFASSQESRFHLPEPRGPTRLSG
jgi:hypothetical protein